MVKKAENRTFEAVIFDMDGVIFDTEHLAMNLWIQAADELDDREGLPVKPGVPELLSSLTANHVPLALASSTYSDLVRQELRDAGFLDYFDVVIGGDMVTHSKPHPEIFLLAANALNTAPENCYVIEDSFNGIRAAAAAGVHPLLVPDMLQPTEEIRSLAEWVFPSLFEVLSFLLESGLSRPDRLHRSVFRHCEPG